jgi:hypothetical protein
MDRDRVGAWVASLPGDHPHLPVFRMLLAEFDKVHGFWQMMAREAARLQAEADQHKARANEALADADRLANWIVQHPQGNPTVVLGLHDRTLA